MENQDTTTQRDKAQGAILGAFIADSIGSALEFQKVVVKGEAEVAMTMPGNMGPWKIAAG